MAPNSPRLRAKERLHPAMNAGKIAGHMILANICQLVAPNDRAASSTSAATSSNTGCTVRTTKGMLVNIIARAMPSGAYATFIPNGSRYWPNQPFEENTVTNASPATAVGNAKGQIDHRIEKASPRKLITNQNPCQQDTENRVEHSRKRRCTDRNAIRRKRALRGYDTPEIGPAKVEGFIQHGQKRQRNDNDEIKQGHTKRETETRQYSSLTGP